MDAQPAIRLLEQGIAFVERTGLKVEQLERGRVRCRMPLTGNANHIGTLYAGALFTCAEIPGGALFLSTFDPRRCYPVVKSLDLQFLKPATSDVTVDVQLSEDEIQRIEADLNARGKAEFVLNTELIDAQGVVVARSHGVYQLRSTAPRPA